jgi:hypothetical protein
MMTDDERKRVVQLLGMLGSDFDGEVLNAARCLENFRSRCNVSWQQLMEDTSAPPGVNQTWAGGGGGDGKGRSNKELEAAYDKGFNDGVKAQRDLKRTWKLWAKERVEEDQDMLSEWEINFFGDFSTGRFAFPTAKQHAIFERVADRLNLELPALPGDSQTEMPF